MAGTGTLELLMTYTDFKVGDLLTIERTCELLSVSRRTVYNWIAAGKVQYVRTPGGTIRLVRASLVRLEDAE